MTNRAAHAFPVWLQCVFCFVISRIISSRLAVEIKLPGFEDRIFIALYPGLLLNVAGLLHPVAEVSVPAFCRLGRFSGVFLGLGAMLLVLGFGHVAFLLFVFLAVCVLLDGRFI